MTGNHQAGVGTSWRFRREARRIILVGASQTQ
jgi:hypothetical protein